MPAHSKHGTLTAATVATVTLTEDYDHVEVINRDGVAEIYFTTNGATPTVGGDDTHVLPAAIGGVTVRVRAAQQNQTVVKLISSGAPKYSVVGA